ncbi:MAG: prepilin-type N-terminal cleavage/methylation domain-containing protein, partial [Bacilli bacterium]|nr:prepilin-type N-terminal cleavage/methylation domain-containing protein [Bacilli bacterium]
MGGGQKPYKIRAQAKYDNISSRDTGSVFVSKKAFTLVELIGAIVILGIIAIIAIPLIDKTLKENKERAYLVQINSIKESTKNWAVDNTKLLPDLGNSYILTLKDLQNGGYIGEVINPKTEQPFDENTQIIIQNTDKGYTYEVNIGGISIVINKTPNSNGWLNEDYKITISSFENVAFNYCLSNSECSPINKNQGNKVEIEIKEEGITYVCASTSTSNVICHEYKLDKTKPVIGNITLLGTEGLNGYYVSNVEVNHTESTDALSGIESDILSPNVGTVTTDTDGTT